MTTQNDGNGRPTKSDLHTMQYDLTRAIQDTKDAILFEITTMKVDIAATKTLVDRNCRDLQKAEDERDEIKKEITNLQQSDKRWGIIGTAIASGIASLVGFFSK